MRISILGPRGIIFEDLQVLFGNDLLVRFGLVEELLARVKAIIRRANQPNDEVEKNCYSDSVLSIDFQRHEVFVRGESVTLSATEFRLLTTLTINEGQVLSQEKLLDLVWGQEYDESLSIARLYIAYLRQKIEKDPRQPKLIETVRGFGYRYRGKNLAFHR